MELGLKENGIEIPDGVTFKISENTDKIIHLSLPEFPGKNLEEEALKKVAVGINIVLCG